MKGVNKMKCLNCSKQITKNGLLMKNGSSTFTPGESKKIEYVGEDSFIKCPHCNARNIIADRKDKKGLGKIYFHRFELD